MLVDGQPLFCRIWIFAPIKMYFVPLECVRNRLFSQSFSQERALDDVRDEEIKRKKAGAQVSVFSSTWMVSTSSRTLIYELGSNRMQNGTFIMTLVNYCL